MMSRGKWNSTKLGLLVAVLACAWGCSKPDYDGNREKDAAAGHRPSQIEWGVIYQEGNKEKYPKDLAKAARWYELAGTTTNYTVASGESRWQINERFGIPLELIRAANPEVDMNRIKGGEVITVPGARIAQFNLGMLYEQGMGVKQDLPQAAIWYTRAAKAGLADAQFTLGYLLEKGTASGTIVDTPDLVGAVHWYSRSANQGFGPAQQNLAQLHMKGQGTTQNLVRAYKWFALAGRNAKEYQMPPSTKAEFKKKLSKEEWNAKVKRDEALKETEKNMAAATARLEGAMPPADLTRAKQLVETFVAKREK
ncbi:MAG TPA: sel1 repeat family protein [Verrucomicrobiales bacterium]|jgi:TPR repeat protein|nr:sel1 repeat family protein [Verrucomicrobiales bacterium]HIL23908.1 sel1 repeat family protein [Verrucomicrobiota bacterium]